jgi:cytochrome c553
MRVERWCRRVVVLAAFGAAAAVQAQQPAAPPQAQLCAACHGAAGRSQQPLIPSLAAQPKLFIENQLVLIREGLRDVPQMKGLLDGMPDAEIVALASYFAAQQPPPAAAAADAASYRRGQALADKALCGSCHLPDFSGRQQIPRLAGQHEAFLVQAMKQFRDHPGLGRDTIMAASLYGLKDQDLADLAHFLAHFRPAP